MSSFHSIPEACQISAACRRKFVTITVRQVLPTHKDTGPATQLGVFCLCLSTCPPRRQTCSRGAPSECPTASAATSKGERGAWEQMKPGADQMDHAGAAHEQMCMCVCVYARAPCVCARARYTSLNFSCASSCLPSISSTDAMLLREREASVNLLVSSITWPFCRALLACIHEHAYSIRPLLSNIGLFYRVFGALLACMPEGGCNVGMFVPQH